MVNQDKPHGAGGYVRRHSVPIDHMEQPTTVALLEAGALMRSLLVRSLAEQPGFAVVLAEASFAELALHAAGLPAPHLVVVGCEATPADLSDTELIGQVRALWPAALVLAVTNNYEVAVVLGGVRAGCNGMDCRRLTDFDQLLLHIQQLLSTGVYYPREVAGALAQPPPAESGRERIRRLLNDTQLHILECVCAPDEPTWSVVADRVARSTGCVGENATLMYARLQVRGKPGLVALGRKYGFGQG